MHVSTADVGDTGWLQAESVENNVVTEPPKGALLKCWPDFVQDLIIERVRFNLKLWKLKLGNPTADQDK